MSTFKRPRHLIVPLTCAMLGATALGCGEPDVQDDLPGEPDSILITTSPVEAGDECPTGGVLIETGADLNYDGVLDDDEISSSETECYSPDGGNEDALLEIEAIAPGEECEFGGQRVLSGVDANADGELGEDEVLESQVVCNDAAPDVCAEREALEIVSATIPSTRLPFFVEETYPLQVELGSARRAEQLQLQLLGASGDQDIEIDAIDGTSLNLLWTPRSPVDFVTTGFLVVSDGCSLRSAPVFMPKVNLEYATVALWSDAQYQPASAESAEVCWTSAAVEDCQMSLAEEGAQPGTREPVDTSGCRDIPVETRTIVTLSCEPLDGADVPAGSMLGVYSGPQIISFRAYEDTLPFATSAFLTWQTHELDGCQLINGDETLDVESNIDADDSYALSVETSTTLRLVCEDSAGEVYESQLSIVVEGSDGPGDDETLACAATPRPDRCDADPQSYAFGPASLLTELEIPDEDCCFSVEGGPANANAFKDFLEVLAPGSGFNGLLADALQTGTFDRVLEHEGLSALSAPSDFKINVLQSSDIDFQAGVNVTASSFEEGAYPLRAIGEASLVEQGGPAEVVAEGGSWELPLGAFVTDAFPSVSPNVVVDRVIVEAEAIASSAIVEDGVILMEGRIGGAVSLAQFVRPYNAAAETCDCLGNPTNFMQVNGAVAQCQSYDEAQAATCGDGCSDMILMCDALPLFSFGFLDVDADGDQVNESMSIGLHFDAEATTILGVQ